MGDSKLNPVAVAKEPSKQTNSGDTPGFEDLLKAHIRLVAAQRNANGLAASLREAQQQIEAFSRQFQELKSAVETRTGFCYNEETLVLEGRK